MSTLRKLTMTLWCVMISACGQSDAPPRAAPIASPTAPPPATVASDDARCRLATADSAATEDCPAEADTDHDGVEDGADGCPDTTPGIAVDSTGCAAIGQEN